jgi:hypothetical protein
MLMVRAAFAFRSSTMADHHETETPSQGIFIGYTAIVLLALAVLVAVLGITAGMRMAPIV